MNVGIVMDTQTKVAVRWQDGTMTHEAQSTHLVPVQHVLHADFWPEDFVVDKGEGAHDRVGVVKRVIASARTCDVMWLQRDKDVQQEKDQTSTAGVETEEVSMYAIESHPDFSYRLGCIVLRLSKDSPTNNIPINPTEESSTSTASIEESSVASPTKINNTISLPVTTDSEGEEAGEDEYEDAGSTEEDNNNNNSQPQETSKGIGAWVGQIVNIHNGIITVAWADGSSSAARPEELFKINDDDYESESSDTEDEYPNIYLLLFLIF